MSLILRPPWTQQPQTYPGVDWSSPLTRGLVFCAIPYGGTFVDLVTGVLGAPTGGPARNSFGTSPDVPGAGPTSAVGGTAQTQYVVWPASSTLRGGSFVGGGAYTMLAWAAFDSQPAGTLLSVGGTTETNVLGDGPYLAVDTGAWLGNGTILIGRYQGVAAGAGGTFGVGSSFSGRLHCFGAANDGAAGDFFANGATQSWGSASVGGSNTAGRRAWLLRDSVATSGTVKASVALFLSWSRRISVEEYRSLYRNPWQLFEPRRIWVPVSAAGGGSVTLTAAQGSYSLTGQAAGLRVARTLTAAQGSYSLSGQAASIRTACQLVAGQGSYTLTGQAAALLATRRLVADQGAYALAGQSSALRAARQITAAQGSYALTGQDATLTYSGAGAKTLLADAGSYALTGQAAALRVARKFTAGQGAYSYTGQDAALRRLYTLTAGQGAYALTGQPTGILRGLRLPAAQGSYTLSGQAATLTYSGAAGSTISIVQPYITVYFWRRTA